MDTRENTFHTPAPVRLRSTFAAGALQVHAEQTETSTVRITPDKDTDKAWSFVQEVTVELAGDELVVRAPDGGWLKNPPGLSILVTVPTGSALSVTVASADVRTTGQFADGDVTTASGDVELSDLSGELRVKTASGDIRTGAVGGRVRINAASGDIALGDCADEVSVNSASGDIVLATAASSVNVKTASGDVIVGSARSGRVSINTASGDVRVGVAAGTGVYLDLTSLSGDTTTDLDMEGDEPTGSTELTLAVRSLSGDIDLHRAS